MINFKTLRILNKKYVFIVIISFLCGLFIMHLIYQGKIAESKNTTRRIIDNCLQGFVASNSLITVCNEAYKETSSCISNLASCDMEKSKKRLFELNKEREVAEQDLKRVSNEAQLIINDIMKIKGK